MRASLLSSPAAADREHHDQNAGSWTPQGVRVFTFFMYLSDVEEGGETYFPKLGIKVRPRLGSAIMWPSVHDEDMTQTDRRTNHAALPVQAGLKVGANLWVHQHDFRTPSFRNCLLTQKNTEELRPLRDAAPRA